MAQRFFELDKNSFSRYLGRGVCFAIELSHSSWDETYYLINNTKELQIGDTSIEGWTQTSSGTNQWNDVAYGHRKFVAVGNSGYITTSTDGETWTTPIQITGIGHLGGIAYGNNKFVAVNSSIEGYYTTSTDGINWTTPAIISNDIGLIGITYCNNKFIAYGSTNGRGYLTTSFDGITWTTPVNSGLQQLRGVAYGNGKYIAVDYYGWVSTSIDLETWTTPVQLLPATSLNYWYGIIFCNNKFIAYGQYLSSTTDGETWTTPEPIHSDGYWLTCHDIAYSKGIYVAVGAGGQLSTSTDGETWSALTQIGTTNLYGITYGNNKFVAVGNNGGIIVGAYNKIIYQPYPFDIILPAQTEQQGTQIVFSNVQNLAANLIRQTVDSNENIALQLYVANVESETAEMYDKGLFEIFNPLITSETVQATINLRHSFDINCGSIRYNRQLFPNLFL